MPVSKDSFDRNRWAILAIVLIGSLVGTFGNSMANVALPAIMDHYSVGIDVGVWVVTIYVLLFSTLMPLFGRLGDMFGYKRIYLVGMVVGAVASALCAVAPSIGWLIFFRVLAGIGNGPTLPAIMAIIAEVFPPERRGAALGFWATANGAGHGFGPVISGFLVQYLGWPSVFWFNGLLTAVGAVLIFLYVPADHRRARESFDAFGAFTLTATMIMIMFSLTEGLSGSYPPLVIAALWAAAAGLFAAFLISQARRRNPFVDLRLFRNAGYAVVTYVSATQLFCWFGLNLLLPLFFINQQGRTPSQAGLLMAALATSLALLSPLAGRLSDRVGSRFTTLLGMGVVAAGGLWLTTWGAGTPAWLVAITLIILGSGMSLTQSPTAKAVTHVVGLESLGVALGIFNMLRFVAGTLGQTIFGAVLNRGGGPQAGLGAFRLDFVIFAVMAGLAALAATRMPAVARVPLPVAREAGLNPAGD